LVDALTALQKAPAAQVIHDAAPAKATRRMVLPVALALLLIVGLAAGGYFYFTQNAGPGPADTPVSEPSEPGSTAAGAAEKEIATLNISSEPAGATIYVDSLFMGQSPMDIELPLGKHELRLSLANYLAWEAQVDIDTPGQMPLHISMRKSD
jgi:hypothetical protein